MTMFKTDIWEDYKPKERVGKLCYYLCSKQSILPIRDILDDHGKGNKREPNIETGTYNWCRPCNQTSVRIAIKDGLSHILFITKYTGYKEDYINRYFIVGYYEIGWVAIKEENNRNITIIKAEKACFVPIDKAYEVTNERWRKINLKGKTEILTNLRYATQKIAGDLLDEIINHLNKGNAFTDFKQEIEGLKLKQDQKKNRNYCRSLRNC